MALHHKKRITGIVFTAFLFVMLMSSGAFAKTAKYYKPSQASSWIRAQAGKTINYWNPPSNAQCTELVYYYYKHFDVNAPDTDAWQYSEAKPPSGWKKIPYYSGFTAQKGDVAVWTGGSYGHVALIVSADTGSFLSLDQNMNGRHSAAFYRHSYGTEGGLTFWGVIRPNFKGGRKDSHAVSCGRKIRSCIYYYRGSRKTLIVKEPDIWYRNGKKGGSFTVYYKNKKLNKKKYSVRYSLNLTKKAITCYITGKGAYRNCRGKITVPIT